MPVTTKEGVIKGLSTIWAKIYLWNKKAAKEFVTEASKQLVKKLVEKGVHYLPELMDKVKKIPEILQTGNEL